MRYRRNWLSETTADVFFNDGSDINTFIRTERGRITSITLDGETHRFTPELAKEKGIKSVHFTTPAMVEFK